MAASSDPISWDARAHGGDPPRAMSMRIADKDTTELRFAVGTRMECNCGTWEPGIIVQTFYEEEGFGPGRCVP